MKGDLTNEHQALLSLCLNNAGVDAFERGHLGKAMMFFQVALTYPECIRLCSCRIKLK